MRHIYCQIQKLQIETKPNILDLLTWMSTDGHVQ